MKKSKLQIQMKGIGNLASVMADFHALHKRNTVLQFSQSQTGKLEMCVFNIHDTLSAFDYYMTLKEAKSVGERYLLVCGVFQALFLQQDAISFLREIMLPEKGQIRWEKEFPPIDKIRQYRNRYFGHPTEGRKKVSFHVGSLQPSSESLGQIELLNMQLYKGVENAIFMEKVDVQQCIKEQVSFAHALFLDMATQLNVKLVSSPRNL